MSDVFGALSLPVPVPTARNDLPIPLTAGQTSLADPALDTLLSYIQAVLEYELTTAWAVRAPGNQIKKAARFTSTNDPLEGEFNDNQLPGLFLFRSKGEDFHRYAADLPATAETLLLHWVFPADTQHKERLRNNVINGLSKALVTWLEWGVHPAWVVAGDLAQPAAIRLAAATPTAAVVYSGAELNGLIGGGTVNAGRPVSVTTIAAVGAYNTTDPITITGTLPSGETGFTDTLTLTAPNGGQTVISGWNFASVQSIAVPAQLLGTGSWTFGYAASPEAVYGSPVRRHAGLKQLRCEVGRRRPLVIQTGKDARAEYDCVEFVIHIQEMFAFDISVLPQWGPAAGPPTADVGMFTDFTYEDGDIYSQANFTEEDPPPDPP